jgi:hypothetical protein
MLEYAGLLTDILVGAGESGKIDQTGELSIGLATRRNKDRAGHGGLRLPRVVRESNRVILCCHLGINAISVKSVLITSALHGIRFHEFGPF